MALLKDMKGSFVGGHVSPELQNRIDLEKFNTFLKEAKNTQLKPEGGVSNRAGTVFVGVAKTSTYRLTITVDVPANIVINGVLYTGKTASVDLPIDNATYEYRVSAEGYKVLEGDGELTENTVLDLELEEDIAQYTLTINVVEPAGTTIRMKVNDGNWSVQSYVTANSGSRVEWEVSKAGYVTQGDIVLLDQTQTIPVTLVEESPKATLTVTATPEGSTITIDGVETNTAEVTIGESATVVVSKDGYITYSQSVEVTETTNLSIDLMQDNISIVDIKNPKLPSQWGYYIEKVSEVYSKTLYKTGVYKVTMGGQKGCVGSTSKQAGKLQFNISCANDDVIKVKILGGGYGTRSGDTNNYYSGGLSLWINNECVAVAGGGGGLVATGYSYYLPLGGGGYEGGKVKQDGHGYINYGISYDGSYGDSTSNDANKADGEYISSGGTYAYGGSGYVKSSAGITSVIKSRHSGNAFFQLEFVG